jgi:hypothetical protein
MATLYVSYFGAVDKGVAGDPIKSETITTSGVSAASGAIPDGAIVARFVSDASHYVTIDTGTPTASAANGAVQFANQELWLRVRTSNRATLKAAAVTV